MVALLDGVQFGGFGMSQTGWVNVLAPTLRMAQPGRGIAEALNRYAAVPPTDYEVWAKHLPSMTCTEMCRSIGLDPDVGAICAAFDQALGVNAGQGWPVARQMIQEWLNAAEEAKWRTATCVQRSDADGGGSLCTAADGDQRVQCYDEATGTYKYLSPDARCASVAIQSRTLTTSARTISTVSKSAPSTTSAVAGRVVDSAGRGVAGASVGIRTSAGFPVRATTDADGAFVLQYTPGTYHLVISAEGYDVASVDGVVLASGKTLTLSPITLEASTCPAGQAKDPATGRCVPVSTGCPEGQMADPVTGLCVPVSAGCPDGQVVDPATGLCVGSTPKAEETPWYSSPWVWVLGGVVVLGGGYLVWRSMKKE